MKQRMILGLVLAFGVSAAAYGASDFQFTIVNNGTSSWSLTAVSDPSLFAGALPASNPTINLVVGKRYGVTNVSALFHITQIIAKGATAGSDVVLLSAGGTTGSFESDPAVNWFDDGATSNNLVEFTLTANLLAAMQAGGLTPGYRCGIHTTTMRGNFNVTSVGAPTITTQPISRTVNEGASVSFTIAASGAGPISFQWQKNSASISGATDATLTFPSVQASNAGTYVCIATNSGGGTPSNLAVLTVNTPPLITLQPVSQTVNSGASVNFSVAATGTPTLSFQWRKNTVDIAGAASATFNIPSAQPADAGSYTCVVTNPVNSVTSNAATLTINTAPVITTQPVSQTVNAGTSASFTIAASGAPPITFQWRKNSVDISGATAGTLTIPSVQTSDAGTYDCIATNAGGGTTSNPALLTVHTPPVITTQPLSQTVDQGLAANFTVAATGTAPLSFQWQKNSVNIGGATADILSIPSVQPTDAGSYACVVTNPVTSVTSNAATLTVHTAPVITTQPVSQTVNPGTTVNFSVAATGTPPLSFQWRKNATDIPGATDNTFSIPSVQTADAGSYTCVVTDSAASVTSNPAILSVNGSPVITTQPISQTVDQGVAVSFIVAATGTAPLSFQWQKNSVNIGGATSATLSIASAQPADAGSYACMVTNIVTSVTSNAATLTVNVPPVITTQPVSQTVNPGAAVSFTVAATGTPPLSFLWRKNGSAIGGATTDTFNIASAQAGDAGSYTCVVTDAVSGVTSNAAILTVNGPPVITTQPLSQTVNQGAAVSFVVAATGTPPLSFQWRKDGVDIAGATSATLSIGSVQTSDAGIYTCAVTNIVTSIASDAATLTVGTGPVITTQPIAQTVDHGAQANFSVTATGAAPISYQWMKNNANITGATAATFSIPSAQPSDAGLYKCVVSNPIGNVTSNTVTLTVNCPALSPPDNVQASDGTFTDKAQVTWNAVSGATGYKIFRDPSATATSPQLLNTVDATATLYNDTTADPPRNSMTGGFLGCFQQTQTNFVKYYYFVETVNDCGDSALSTPDQGWRGGPGVRSAATSIREEAIPSRSLDGATRLIQPDSALFLRLSSSADIDPATITGSVSASGLNTDALQWMPVEPTGLRDFWIIYTPDRQWLPGEVITMTASASTVSGKALDATACQFKVESETESPAATGGAIPQPDYAAIDSNGLDLSAEANHEANVTQIESQAFPALSVGVGVPYAIGPEEAYDVPQRVWLPVPAGLDANNVQVFYLHEIGPDAGWYRAEDVIGWLEPDSYRIVTVAGTTYFGLTVRHSGIVQLGLSAELPDAAPAAASVIPFHSPRESAGDLLLFVVVFGAFAIKRRLIARARSVGRFKTGNGEYGMR